MAGDRTDGRRGRLGKDNLCIVDSAALAYFHQIESVRHVLRSPAVHHLLANAARQSQSPKAPTVIPDADRGS